MSKADFEKRLCISYVDEATVYSYKTSMYNAVASMITSKTNYIDNIETQWIELRKKYDIPDGICIHFTDIKALLNPVYYTKPDRNVVMEKIFCNAGNTLDKGKLYSFYNDVLKVIKNNEFVIQVTGMRIDKKSFIANKDIKKYGTGNWYPIFKRHLEAMVYHLIFISYQEHQEILKEKPKANFRSFIAKIRYDGDIDLSSRNDLRDAFSHCVTNGTERFNADAVKACLDEVRFIDKSEIGFCGSCDVRPCTSRFKSHAGNEILDFITIFVARKIAYEFHIKDAMLEFGISEEEARKKIDKDFKIRIDGYESIEPLIDISPKVFTGTP